MKKEKKRSKVTVPSSFYLIFSFPVNYSLFLLFQHDNFGESFWLLVIKILWAKPFLGERTLFSRHFQVGRAWETVSIDAGCVAMGLKRKKNNCQNQKRKERSRCGLGRQRCWKAGNSNLYGNRRQIMKPIVLLNLRLFSSLQSVEFTSSWIWLGRDWMRCHRYLI